jgi:hypothetical protein
VPHSLDDLLVAREDGDAGAVEAGNLELVDGGLQCVRVSKYAYRLPRSICAVISSGAVSIIVRSHYVINEYVVSKFSQLSVSRDIDFYSAIGAGGIMIGNGALSEIVDQHPRPSWLIGSKARPLGPTTAVFASG